MVSRLLTIAVLLTLSTALAAAQAADGAPLSLAELLIAYGSDKELHHGYSRYYEPILAPLRYSAIRFLEIGVENGNSTTAWQAYFGHDDTEIFGIGFGNWQTEAGLTAHPVPCQKTPNSMDGTVTESDEQPRIDRLSGKCTLFHGDQSDASFLAHFLQASGGHFDVVIDDGSHYPPHQLVSFEALWGSVAPGGLYFIEDIETSYWRKNTMLYGNICDGQLSSSVVRVCVCLLYVSVSMSLSLSLSHTHTHTHILSTHPH